MLNAIGHQFQVLAKGPPAEASSIEALNKHFGDVPEEYIETISDATEIELQHEQGRYIRIWGPAGCIEMDEGYDIRERISGAFPIGDDGGGRVIFYMQGTKGLGLYLVGYGNLDREDATFIAPSLREFLANGVGVGSF